MIPRIKLLSQAVGYPTWDITNILVENSLKLETDTDFSAGVLSYDLVEVDEGYVPNNGDTVQLTWNDKIEFYGFVFKVGYDSDERFHVTAYDQKKYLKSEDSIVWPSGTLTQRFNKICTLAGLPHKVVDGASYKLPVKLSDGDTYFKMIQEDAESTRLATGETYFLDCEKDVIVLNKVGYKRLDFMVTERSYLVSWEFNRDVEEMYNAVKVVKSSEKAKMSEHATEEQKIMTTALASETASSSGSISKFGRLQKVEKVNNDDMNSAQMRVKAKQLLADLSKEQRELKIVCIGSSEFRIGVEFVFDVLSLRQLGYGNLICKIKSCKQNFSSNEWLTEMVVEF